MILKTIWPIKPILSLLIAGLMCLAFGISDGSTATGETHGLNLSSMQVKITSKGHTATFQLYDTTAAKEFYDQLPLSLQLENFRDAQWMFYPPQKLKVKPGEAYHDGKKGELSYYAPWGDVFMLYKDFYAGDEMHRLGIGVSGIDEIGSMSGTAIIEKDELFTTENRNAMFIQVLANGKTTVFKLNDSPAAKALYGQLPLTIDVEDYASNEKIFYPPKKLDTSDTPKANALAGTLAYYAPWGDVVMFYENFGSASGLYQIGEATIGNENIKHISGTITIDKITPKYAE